ncbi:tyrosine-type recombinase/integrase [Azospirillum sp. SYSU D00513]|uniref:tyrosine-type recombinase/integrase n=1 Tax=Azospirillum sp. SYSU D00513 TaxID=2812561 RepID=UPI001A95AFCC|nr:tyrosine-type recombinase/integrase [Azospirillum sp. SYSU D00513]
MYLEKRRQRWYALHDIPSDVQGVLGRRRFVQSLETEDKATARQRAAILEAQWLSEISKARKGSTDPIEEDALFWRKILENAPTHERGVIRHRIMHKARRIARVHDGENPEDTGTEPHDQAARFIGIATGQLTRLDEHLEEYLRTLNNEAKTVDMKRATVQRFAEEFPYLQDVQRKTVQRWVNKLGEGGKAVATIRRSLSELRGYWAYLTSIEAVSENALPFEKLSMPKASKKENGSDDRQPFTAEEVVKLLNAAVEKNDKPLADLIRLGMWTGARIEELCALKVDKVAHDVIAIEDAKTAAGWRKVPVHSKLKPTMDRLLGSSEDGYVLSGLTPNKYGDRSNAIGKRFGRLKAALGFGEAHVYHSLRKTVATLLEDAGVPENVSADILGHDKPTMTYGLYSGGTSIDTKRKALELIGYPS